MSEGGQLGVVVLLLAVSMGTLFGLLFWSITSVELVDPGCKPFLAVVGEPCPDTHRLAGEKCYCLKE